MLGETSMLKEGLATASVAADQITTVVEMKVSALDALFKEHPRLPARFFCFLATYQGERLYKLTQAFADSQTPQVTIAASLAIPIEEVVHIPAFCGKLRTYLLKAEETASTKVRGLDRQAARRPSLLSSRPPPQDEQARALGLLTLFEFYVDVQDEYAELPDKAALTEEAPNLQAKYLVEGPKTSLVIPGAEFICKETCAEVDSAISSLKSGGLSTRKARQIFAGAQTEALAALNAGCYDAFMGSKHYRYILELKAKEKIVPALEDFKVVRVLGEGGFGQVIEVIKRDCGVHYALKVMRKEMLKECLGSSWRKKIALEQSILATLQHPFLVNLKYAFQNPEFLLLVMDLVPQGDLSEFVLTKRRLTPPQVKWAIMETVEVMGYIHGQSILYRDLKPENLLVDEQARLSQIPLARHTCEHLHLPRTGPRAAHRHGPSRESDRGGAEAALACRHRLLHGARGALGGAAEEAVWQVGRLVHDRRADVRVHAGGSPLLGARLARACISWWQVSLASVQGLLRGSPRAGRGQAAGLKRGRAR